MNFSPEEINKLREVAQKQAKEGRLDIGKTLEEITAVADKKVGPKPRKHRGKVDANIETQDAPSKESEFE